MSNLEMKDGVEAEDVACELSDEALDRVMSIRLSLPACSSTCAVDR